MNLVAEMLANLTSHKGSLLFITRDLIQQAIYEINRLELELEHSEERRAAAESEIKYLEREARLYADEQIEQERQRREESYRW